MFYGKLPTPDNVILPINDNYNITSNDEEYIRRVLFNGHGETLKENNEKFLVYNNNVQLDNIMFEMFLLKKYNYTSVVNMPGHIHEIITYGNLYGICVHDKRNLKRIMDLCSDSQIKKINHQ